MTIDPNAPIGTVFFEHYVTAQSGQNFKCQTANNYILQGGYVYGTGGQTVALSGGGLVSQNGSTYPVYKTNVPCIGLVVRFSGNAFPYWWGTYSYTNRVLDYTGSMTQVIDIDIVKYGDIPTGSRTVIIDSTVISSINSVSRVPYSGDTSRLPNGDVIMAQFALSPSSFDIVSGTCDTPDMTINLGSRSIANTSNRAGNKFVTPWIDASIRLTNFSVFYGTGDRGNDKDLVRNNVLTVTLMPNKSTSSNQGIMPVDSGSQAATGGGILLAYGTSASPQLVDFSSGSSSKSYTMSSSQGNSFTIPLEARYMQTANTISEINVGLANGKITYLIEYY